MNAIRTAALHESTLFRAVALNLGMALAGTAQADCGPVIAAYTKAEATGRYALFDVNSLTEAPKGQPFHVTIGGAGYINMGETYKKGGGSAGFEGSNLKNREKKGEARCEPLGERKIGAEQAIGYQILRNDNGKPAPDANAIDMWVNRSTGLPMFHGIGWTKGGLRWVYGAEVSAPPPNKVK